MYSNYTCFNNFEILNKTINHQILKIISSRGSVQNIQDNTFDTS